MECIDCKRMKRLLLFISISAVLLTLNAAIVLSGWAP